MSNDLELLRLVPLFQEFLAQAGTQRAWAGQGLEITTAQMTALEAVYRKGNPTMSDLAREMGNVPSAATRIVEELVKQGLAERASDPEDGRAVRIKITAKGSNIIEARLSESQAQLTAVLKAMGPVEKVELARGLRAFLEAVRKMEGDATPEGEGPGGDSGAQREGPGGEERRDAARKTAQEEYAESLERAKRTRRLIG